MKQSATSNNSIGWFALAIVAAAAVIFFAFLFQEGACYDAAERSGATSYCTSGPAVGIVGAWIISGIGVIVIFFSVWRAGVAIRRSRRSDAD